jgi:S-adenosylmethionine hydrolase
MGKTLDKTRHHITVHGREESGQAAAYMQDGIYFDGEGAEIEGMRATAAPSQPKAGAKPATGASSQVDKQLAG